MDSSNEQGRCHTARASNSVTFKDSLISLCTEKAKTLGRKLTNLEVVDVADELHAKSIKERKKSEIDERASQILNVYPRRQGGEAGLTAITKAIVKDGFEKVLEGASEYASAVARWAYARRVSQSGSSLIPLPATWFGNRCYLDDPKYWWEGTGKEQKEEKEAILLAEPERWRFAHPDNRFVTEHIAWSAIDTASQRWIIANMPKRNTA